MIKKNNSRRDFIKKSSLAATGLAFSFSAKSYGNIIGANDRLNIAVAGINGRGRAHLSAVNDLNKKAQVIALCDVDTRTFEKAFNSFPSLNSKSTRTYIDFREMLENKDVDIVTVATPDHWHTPMAISSMQAGKHVYLEKPASHNPLEGEWLIAAQKKEDKVLQIGNQQRSAPTSKQAVEDIRNGIIGDVYHAKAWYANDRGPIGTGKEIPVPNWLNWDLWQGPAPRTAYKDNYVHYNWHWFWNWGTGEVNNNGLHELDICRWAMGVDLPDKISSSGGRYHFDDDWEFYDTQIVNYEFGNDKMITWEGRSCNGQPYFGRGRGAMIYGTKGSILLDRNGYLLYDLKGNLLNEQKEGEISATTDTIGVGNLDVLHMNNFFRAITHGENLNSPVEDINNSNLICHLGNISQKMGRSLIFENDRIKNDNAAMEMWGREYANGWAPQV
jgi:predicted dehydrogenase